MILFCWSCLLLCAFSSTLLSSFVRSLPVFKKEKKNPYNRNERVRSIKPNHFTRSQSLFFSYFLAKWKFFIFNSRLILSASAHFAPLRIKINSNIFFHAAFLGRFVRPAVLRYHLASRERENETECVRERDGGTTKSREWNTLFILHPHPFSA